MTAPVPGPPPRPSRALISAAGTAGLVVGALVVGVVWFTVGSSADSDGVGSAAGTKPVSAPATAGAYQRFADVPVNQQAAAEVAVEQRTNQDKKSAELLSQTYHGAAATVETYASANLDVLVPVYIVRAPSPDLFTPYTDLSVLRLKVPEREMKTFGDVHCVVQNSITGDTSPDQLTVYATECQRSNANLTVHIPGLGAALGAHPEQVAAVVDQVFDAVD